MSLTPKAQDAYLAKVCNGSRVFITGINGFVGSHLAEAYLADGALVYGTIRGHRSPMAHLRNALAGPHKDRLKLIPCDITDPSALYGVMHSVHPALVHHLAAQSYVPESWKNPAATVEANITGTLNVLEAARKLFAVRVHFASSSEAYGRVEKNETPITEDNHLRPLSPYGVSKAAADMLCRQYAASYKLNVVVTRAFNHSGPRRGVVFAESDWARQIAVAEQVGKRGPCVIKHGNLEAVRDYVDVRDIVRGYRLAVQTADRNAGRVYNLCSGTGLTMERILNKLAVAAKVKVRKEVDHDRMRPSDVLLLVGKGERAESELGWKPRHTADEMLVSLLDYWREEVKR